MKWKTISRFAFIDTLLVPLRIGNNLDGIRAYFLARSWTPFRLPVFILGMLLAAGGCTRGSIQFIHIIHIKLRSEKQSADGILVPGLFYVTYSLEYVLKDFTPK
jgi:hypothetical protein